MGRHIPNILVVFLTLFSLNVFASLLVLFKGPLDLQKNQSNYNQNSTTNNSTHFI